MMAAFDRLDADGSGYLELSELGQVMVRVRKLLSSLHHLSTIFQLLFPFVAGEIRNVVSPHPRLAHLVGRVFF